MKAALQKQTFGKTLHETPQGEWEIILSPKILLEALETLRDRKQFRFTELMDITAIDERGRKEKPSHDFTVVYHLLSMAHNTRLRLMVPLMDGDTLPSAVGVFPNANWYERETWEMFGIVFEGHGDLRRLLTGYNFDGHPLRKDFPVMGHVEVFYDADRGQLVEKPVDLPQPTRDYKTEQEWEFGVK